MYKFKVRSKNKKYFKENKSKNVHQVVNSPCSRSGLEANAPSNSTEIIDVESQKEKELEVEDATGGEEEAVDTEVEGPGLSALAKARPQ